MWQRVVHTTESEGSKITPILIDIVLAAPHYSTARKLFPPYGVALMAGQMPEKVHGCPVTVRFWDVEYDGPYDPSEHEPDIIWISSLTPGIERAYEIAQASRSCQSHAGKPIKVIIGGIHATVLPHEAILFANIVVRGELTPDFQRHLLERLMLMGATDKEVWRLTSPPATIWKTPARWDLIKSSRYWLPSGIITESGCGMDCPFCSTTSVFGPELRLVEKDCLAADINALPKGLVVVYNDNFLYRPSIACIKRSMLVTDLLWERKHYWGAEVTLRTLKHSIEVARKELGVNLLDYYFRHGCRMMFFGVETVQSSYLKKSLPDDESAKIIREVNAHGILSVGSFVLGVDPEETRDKPSQILEFAIEKAELGGLLVSINTPTPGSANFLAAVKNGTLLHRGWQYYRGEKASIRHPNLSPGDLEAGRNEILTEMCSWKSMNRRIIQPVLAARKPASSLPVLLGANAAAVYSAKRWVLRDYHRSKDEPIVETPLRPEVLAAVERAWAASPTSPRLFDVRQPNDGISLLYDPS